MRAEIKVCARCSHCSQNPDPSCQPKTRKTSVTYSCHLAYYEDADDDYYAVPLPPWRVEIGYRNERDEFINSRYFRVPEKCPYRLEHLVARQ